MPDDTERHYHKVARDEEGNLVKDIDLCECGRDIRHEIHFRSYERPDNPPKPEDPKDFDVA